METNKLSSLLRYAALAGNILFVLWIAFNAMDEDFKGTLIQKLSGIGLISLLILNGILLIGANRKQQQTIKFPFFLNQYFEIQSTLINNHDRTT